MYKPNDAMWWNSDKEELHQSVFSFVRHLDTAQSYRTDDNMRHMRLYGNLEPFRLRNYNAYRAEPSSGSQNRVTINIVQSMIDTIVSKIGKNKPKPTFLTEGGDWSRQRRAQKLTQFVEGVFEHTDFYSKATMAFQDSCIFGTGALKLFREGDKIKVERTFIDELILDDSEAIYGEPRQMHQKKWINKDVLKNMFPDSEGAIDIAGSVDVSAWASNTYDRATNMIMVIESWHLPSGEETDDGKHAICIANHTLFEEEWTKDYYPFVLWRYSMRPLGFWGQGLAERVSGLQLEINKILRTIQVSMHLVSVPKILVEANSKIVSAHLNNKIGGIIKYIGTPPQYSPLGTVPPELFAHLDKLIARSYEQEGISQLSASAAKPSGLNSGKALREYNDLETERFMSLAQRYERAFIDGSKIMIDLAKEISEEFKGFKIKAKSNSFIETIDWKEVAMDEESYTMQVFPTSMLSSTPAGKLQDVQELLQAGFIGKEDGMKLLDFPDLRQFYNFNNAGLEDIQRCIEFMIDKGSYQTPEPYQNLQLGVVKMQQAYLYYRSQGAPEERLELFRRWIEDAISLLKKAQPPAQVPEAIPTLPPEAEALPPEAAVPPQANIPVT